jgi:hypothetical protein
MTNQFNMDEAVKALRAGKDLTGKDGVLMPLIKQLTEAALAAELDPHLREDAGQNRRNGKTSKTIKTGSGSFELYHSILSVAHIQPVSIAHFRYPVEVTNKIIPSCGARIEYIVV